MARSQFGHGGHEAEVREVGSCNPGSYSLPYQECYSYFCYQGSSEVVVQAGEER